MMVGIIGTEIIVTALYLILTYFLIIFRSKSIDGQEKDSLVYLFFAGITFGVSFLVRASSIFYLFIIILLIIYGKFNITNIIKKFVGIL